MPKFNLEVTAQLQSVASLTVPEDYPWHVQLQCTGCRELYPRPAVISSSEVVDGLPGNKNAVHLRITCSFCGKKATVSILQDRLPYAAASAPGWAPLLSLECRGAEPVSVALADDVPLEIVGETGFPFEDAFFDDGEFFAWDEARNEEASVTEFRTRIARA